MKKYIIGILVAILGLLGVNEVAPRLGAVQDTVQATTTQAYWNTTTYPNGLIVLKTTSGYLANVVVTGATVAGGITFYDATTTGAHLNHATTTIANVNTSSPAGTYSYNVSFSRGLVAQFSGANLGTTTITYK